MTGVFLSEKQDGSYFPVVKVAETICFYSREILVTKSQEFGSVREAYLCEISKVNLIQNPIHVTLGLGHSSQCAVELMCSNLKGLISVEQGHFFSFM